MTGALLLNAGASWAAYQVGAIEHLVGDRDLHFDQVVGCGVGGMNGAFVACGKVAELSEFWDRVNTMRLVRPSLRPWHALAVGSPQRRFVQRHITERALIERGVTLAVTTFDLWTGDEIVHRYPGDPMPIVDAIMAAVSTPGLVRPHADGDRLLAEATLIDSVPMAALEPADVVFAVLGGAPLHAGTPRRYGTWRAVGGRALEVNLARDCERAIERFESDAAWHRDIASVVADLRAVAPALGDAIDDVAAELGPVDPPTQLVAITPSAPLGYPLWRFPRRAMRAARELGRRDAARALP